MNCQLCNHEAIAFTDLKISMDYHYPNMIVIQKDLGC